MSKNNDGKPYWTLPDENLTGKERPTPVPDSKPVESKSTQSKQDKRWCSRCHGKVNITRYCNLCKKCLDKALDAGLAALSPQRGEKHY